MPLFVKYILETCYRLNLEKNLSGRNQTEITDVVRLQTCVPI